MTVRVSKQGDFFVENKPRGWRVDEGGTQSTKGEWLHVKQLHPLHSSRRVLSSFSFHWSILRIEVLFLCSPAFFPPFPPRREAESIVIFQSVGYSGEREACVYIYIAISRNFEPAALLKYVFLNGSYFIWNIRDSNIAVTLCLMESRHRDCHWWCWTAMKIHAI